MNRVFECQEEGVAPDYIKEAGENGLLEVHTAIGWIRLTKEDYSPSRYGISYRVGCGDIVDNDKDLMPSKTVQEELTERFSQKFKEGSVSHGK